MQTISVDKGKTYTFSGYIKTNNVSNTNNKGAQFYVAYQDNTGTWKKVESEFINGTNDWERIELTFTLPADSVSNDVHPKMTLTEETGTVYFDSLQFEEGHIANRYNLIENGDFKYNTEFWTNNYDTDSNDTVTTLTDTDYPQNLDKNAFRINGDAIKRKNVYQRIEISGKRDDVFTLGGWAKGESVSVDSSKAFMLDIGIERTDGSYQWQNIFFNDDYGDWQYSVNRIAADSDYKSITVYMIYHYNANTASTGTEIVSYTYDSWGKLISIDGSLKDTVGVKNPYRYRGYRYDTESGLYYLQSRYYNPEWGRYLNADGITGVTGELLSHNLFAYCVNNPVNMDDPSGYWPRWVKVAIGLAAIAVGVAATVATGGAAAPALIGSLQLAATSAAVGAGIGAATKGISTVVRGGDLGDIGASMLDGAIDGACDGFMWGGISAGGMQVGRALLNNAGRGFKIGKNTEGLYRTPSTKGGTLISTKTPKGTKFRVELDANSGLHYHFGKGRKAKIHRKLIPWIFGPID